MIFPMRVLLTLLCAAIAVAPGPASAIVGGMAIADAPPEEAFLLSGVVRIVATTHDKNIRHEIACTGALVARDLVLTAAHCFAAQRPPARQVTVFLGVKDGRVWRRASRVAQAYAIHPEYEPREWTKHDVALVKLARPYEARDLATPVALPLPVGVLEILQPDHSYLTGGFGATSDLGGTFKANQLSTTLKYTRYLAGAPRNFPAPSVLDENHDYELRMRTPVEGGNVCEGDSGAPLLTLVDDKPTTFGVLVGFKSTFENAHMAAEYIATKGNQREIAALNRKYPNHHPCLGGEGVFAEISINRDWIDRTIAAYQGAR